ncbi:MAG: hypothetical protein M1827_006885 [Pycnora praestabilis]|nr:MAG: hypothetical protein M1827_006885 [Pycnora praestabilis]
MATLSPQSVRLLAKKEPRIVVNSAVSAVLVITLGFIGVIEYAFRGLPQTTFGIGTTSSSIQQRSRYFESGYGNDGHSSLQDADSRDYFAVTYPEVVVISARQVENGSSNLPAVSMSNMDTELASTSASVDAGSKQTAISTLPEFNVFAVPSSYVDVDQTSHNTIIISAPSSDYMAPKQTSAVTITEATSNYVAPKQTPIFTTTAGPGTSTSASSSAYVQQQQGSYITSISNKPAVSPASSQHVNPSSKSAQTSSDAATTSAAYADKVQTSHITSSPSSSPSGGTATSMREDPNQIVHPTPMPSKSGSSANADPDHTSLLVSSMTKSGAYAEPDQTSAMSSMIISGVYIDPDQTSTIPRAFLDPDQTSTITMHAITSANPNQASTVKSQGSSSSASSGTNLNSISASSSGAQSSNSPSSSSGNQSSSGSVTISSVVLTFPMYQYFAGAYLPVVLAVLYRIVWNAIYATIKIIEPFIQLSKPDGALAKDALNMYYLSSNLTPYPILAFFRGHWAILCTSIVYVIVGLMASVASETLSVDTRYNCSQETGQSVNRCFPRVSVDKAAARTLEALLAFAAAVIVFLIIREWRIRSGVYADPSRLVTIASLLNHKEVVEDFRKIDYDASNDKLHDQLNAKRYRLTHYRSPTGTSRYGLIPCITKSSQQSSRSRRSWLGKYTPVPNPTTTDETEKSLTSKFEWSNLFLPLRDIVFGTALVGVLCLVVAYYKIGGNNDFNDFMNSQGFGPRFILTLMGSLIDSQWKRIEREVRTISPYRAMSLHPCPPSSTILLSTTHTPLTTIFASLRSGYYFSAFIAAIAILSEVLVIALAGVPFSSGQIWTAFLVSSYLSMVILSLMIIALVSLFFWRRQPTGLPRMPNTVAAVMSYVCASYMLQDFEELEGLSGKEIDQRIRGMGETYGYGQFVGEDWVTRWAVDDNSGLEEG